jgi:hypothetical protein
MSTPNLVRAVTPWYREPWPWLLMLGPAVVVVGGVYLLWLANATSDGLVADDYYKQGMAINVQLERERRSVTLGLVADVEFAADGDVRVTLTGDAQPALLRLRLAHPTRAGMDRTATLARATDGSYTGQVGALPPSRWLIIVETDEWRLPTAELRSDQRRIRLGRSGP